jgi:ribonuclease HI/probable phosphoglycerate mutase
MNNKCLELRNGTNNEAEYYALIEGLKMALKNNLQCIHVEGDSKLIINQMTGTYKVKAENLLPLYTEAMELSKRFRIIKFNHIKRELNKQADKLANSALDVYMNK